MGVFQFMHGQLYWHTLTQIWNQEASTLSVQQKTIHGDEPQFYSFKPQYSHHLVLSMIKLRSVMDIAMIGLGDGHGEGTCRKQRMRVSFSNLPTIPNAAWPEATVKTISSSNLQPQLSRPISGTSWSGHNSGTLIWGSSIALELKDVLTRPTLRKHAKSLHQRAQPGHSLLITSIFSKKVLLHFREALRSPILSGYKQIIDDFYC